MTKTLIQLDQLQNVTDADYLLARDSSTGDDVKVLKEDMASEFQDTVSVDSVSTLRTSSFPANLERLWLSGYYGVGTRGAGPLYKSSGTDDGGIKFEDNNGNIWERPYEDKVLTSWFGGGRGNASEDVAALEAASIAAEDYGRPHVIEDIGKSWQIDQTTQLVPNGGADVIFEGKLLYTGSANEPAVEFGTVSDSIRIFHRRIENIWIERQTPSDWSSTGVVGARTYNFDTGNISIRRIQGFTIGYDHWGFGRGANYNNIVVGLLNNNKYSMRFRPMPDGTGDEGSTNENVIIGGRYTNGSTFNDTIERYGVWLDGSQVTGNIINNNVFIRPAFELFEHAGAEAIPFLCENAKDNRSIAARSEANSEPQARIRPGDSFANKFDFAVVASATQDKYEAGDYIDDQSTYGENFVTIQDFAIFEDRALQTYESGFLPDQTVEYDGAGAYYTGGCFRLTSAGVGNETYAENNTVLNADYVELQANNTDALGVSVDTNDVKELIIRWSNSNDQPGRLVLVGLDSGGTQIDPAVTDFVTGGRSLNTSTRFGGCYQNGNDDDRTVKIKLSSEVKTLYVMWSGGTSNARIRSFTISTPSLAALDVGVPHQVNQSRKNHFLATAQPTGTGAPYRSGMFVWDISPSSGNQIGWAFDGSAWLTGPNYA